MFVQCRYLPLQLWWIDYHEANSVPKEQPALL